MVRDTAENAIEDAEGFLKSAKDSLTLDVKNIASFDIRGQRCLKSEE